MQLRVKVRAALTRPMLGQAFWENVARVVKGDILQRIDTQQQPQGGRIKRNAPSTLARKRKQGKPPLSLVDQHKRLVSSDSYEHEILPGGKGVRIRPRGAERMALARSLVARGYKWIGLSKKGQRALRALFLDEVKRLIKLSKARGGAR